MVQCKGGGQSEAGLGSCIKGEFSLKKGVEIMAKMKGRGMLITAAFVALAFVPSLQAKSSPRWFVDFESGGVFPGYNDVRIPGNSGTLFSLTDDLASRASLFLRVRAGFRFHPRHTLTVLFAPLSLSGSGSLSFPLDYNGVIFPTGTPLDSNYKFNSYRLSWRYGIKDSEKWQMGLGLTAKIRDAHIEITGGEQTTRNSNVGGIPLLNFFLEWRFSVC